MLIWLLSFDYAKAQMHQLAHCGTERGHLGLASGKQAFINSFDVWVVACSNDGSHIQHGAYSGGAGLGHSRAPQHRTTRLSFHWNESQISRQLFRRTEIMVVYHREYIVPHLRANCWNTLEQCPIFLKIRMLVDVCVNILL